MTSNKRDIFYQGRIYKDYVHVNFGRADHWNTESEAEYNAAFEAFMQHLNSFVHYPVQGEHKWVNFEDVTGRYELKDKAQNVYSKAYYDIENESIDWAYHQKVTVAIPTPLPVNNEKVADKAKDGWVSVKDGKHPFGEFVLVSNIEYQWLAIAKNVHHKWEMDDKYNTVIKPTHWQPLPLPPISK